MCDHTWKQIADNGKVRKYMCVKCLATKEEKDEQVESKKKSLAQRILNLIK